jgi:hypothetical protein
LATTQLYMVYSSMTSSDSAYDEVSQYSNDEFSTQLGLLWLEFQRLKLSLLWCLLRSTAWLVS